MIKLLSLQSLVLSGKDLLEIKGEVRDNSVHIKKALEWLKVAQDNTGDGGVAAWYSLATGWAPSYIETTGYIISTFLDCAQCFKDKELVARAHKMADFLLEMQIPNGGFRSEIPARQQESEPVVFDTGQDIIGLIDIHNFSREKRFLESSIKAADFLCSIQEKDGSWIKYEYGKWPRVYETRTAWALLKVYKASGKKQYREAAVKNLEWAMVYQRPNGWFEQNFFPPPTINLPFTHNISYAVEGLLESGLILNDQKYILAAKKAADVLLEYFMKNNFLPGTFDKNWRSEDRYTCLTGDAQIAAVWLRLYRLTKKEVYLLAGKKMNNFLKSIQDTSSSDKSVAGGIKGSYPIYGDIIKVRGYCRMAYLNWAAKFFIDALLEEEKVKEGAIK